MAVPAEQDKTIAQLINDLENLKPVSTEKYSEVNDIKEKTLLFLYGMEREKVDPDINKFVYAVRTFITNFDGSYQLTRGDNPQDHKNAVDTASIIKTSRDNLKSVYQSSSVLNKAEPKRVVELAENVVKKFLSDQGEYFEIVADGEDVTPIKIGYLNNAFEAYDLAGNNAKSMEANDKRSKITSEFECNMTSAGTLIKEADALIGDEKTNSSIRNVESAIAKYGEAIRLYEKHNLNSGKSPGEYKQPYSSAVQKNANAVSILNYLIYERNKQLIYTGIVLLVIFLYLGYAFLGYIGDKSKVHLCDVIEK